MVDTFFQVIKVICEDSRP